MASFYGTLLRIGLSAFHLHVKNGMLPDKGLHPSVPVCSVLGSRSPLGVFVLSMFILI